MDTKGGKLGCGGGGGGMNWEVGIDIYTLICIKQITNRNLLYKIIKSNKNSENVYITMRKMPSNN